MSDAATDAAQSDPLLDGDTVPPPRAARVDTTLWVIPPVIACLLASAPNFSYGYDVGAMGGKFDDIEGSMDFTYMQMESLICTFYIASAIGGLLTGVMIDSAGRRAGVGVASLLIILGVAMQASAHSLAHFFTGRVFAGIGSGIAWASAGAYISETTHSDTRGTLVSSIELTINAGLASGYTMSWIFFFDGWRLVFALAVIPPAVAIACLVMMPESPRWLFLAARNPTAAEMVLERVEATHEEARERVNELAALTTDDDQVSWAETLASEQGRTAVMFAAIMGIFCQGMGIEAILYYSATLLEEAGISDHLTIVRMQVGLALAKGCGNLLPMSAADYFGRRPLILLSSGGITVGWVALTLSFSLNAPSYVLYLAMLLTVSSFATGVSPLSLVVTSESTQSRFRARALSVYVCFNRLAAAAVAYTFLTLRHDWGGEAAVTLMYMCIALTGLGLYYFMVPEMRGAVLDTRPSVEPPLWLWLNGKA